MKHWAVFRYIGDEIVERHYFSFKFQARRYLRRHGIFRYDLRLERIW